MARPRLTAQVHCEQHLSGDGGCQGVVRVRVAFERGGSIPSAFYSVVKIRDGLQVSFMLRIDELANYSGIRVDWRPQAPGARMTEADRVRYEDAAQTFHRLVEPLCRKYGIAGWLEPLNDWERFPKPRLLQ